MTETAQPTGVRGSRPGRLALASSLVVTFLAASSAPTPLYERYERTWHATPLVGTVAFAVYAVTVLVGLLFLGELSDRLGRRPVVLAAIALQVAALTLFTGAGSFAPILVGRVLQGIGAGAALGTLGAIMIDAHPAKGTITNAASPGMGTGLGALASGLVVQFLPWPTHLIYLALIGLLVVQAAATVVLLDRQQVSGSRRTVVSSIRPRIAVPRRGRAAFRTAAPVIFAVWGLAGFYGSLGPALFHGLAHDDSVALGALGLFLLAGVASLSTIVLRAAAPRTVMLTGVVALVVGLVLTVVAVLVGSAAGYLLATMVAGVGFGSGFQGGIRTVLATAEPAERTGALSAVFLVAYLGMAIPAVAAGDAVTRGAGLTDVAAVVAAVLAVLAVVALASASPTRRGARMVEPEPSPVAEGCPR